MSKKLPVVNGDLELVLVDNSVLNTVRYKTDENLVAIQKQAVTDLINVIDSTPKTVNNVLVLESYAKTLATLKNKIDKQRKGLKELLNREGEEVHKFYNTTFIKPLEGKIKELKSTVEQLSTPIELEVVGEKETAIELPLHIIELKCETVELTKVLSYLTQLGIEYEVK